ncbi:MAG TPA: site-specific integrase [Methylomirabilota bacterium]|nr:site-specific integrase [Methylomirabilota bacterium]
MFGSCRRVELCDLRTSDIKREGSSLIITVRPTKTEKGRKFAVVDDSAIAYVQLFNKYLSLRPENVDTDRVFLRYANGKCTKQVVGINNFGACPSRVARFLNLPEAEKYTGHAFRRTSATIMANGGMSIDELKRQVGWKSSAVAAGYVEESTVNKVKVSNIIAGAVSGESIASTSSGTVVDVHVNKMMKELQSAGIKISGNHNCTFNITLK